MNANVAFRYRPRKAMAYPHPDVAIDINRLEKSIEPVGWLDTHRAISLAHEGGGNTREGALHVRANQDELPLLQRHRLHHRRQEQECLVTASSGT